MKKNLASAFVITITMFFIAFVVNTTLFSQTSDPHAGHDHAKAPAAAVDPHAGHDHEKEPAAAADPHAGHGHEKEPAAAVDPHAGHDHEKEPAVAADPHAGHDHSSHANPGIMSVEDLFKPECEHNIKTIDCDECRYELGAVKVSDQAKAMLKTLKISQTQRRNEIAFRGELEYDNQLFRTVANVLPGIVSSITVRNGENVEQGQILAVIESAELSHLALELRKLVAELDLSQKKLAREELLHDKKVGAMQTVQEARASRDLKALEIKCSKERLAMFGLSGKDIDAIAAGRGESTQKGQLKVISPIQGRVVKVHVNIGSAISEQQAILDIVNIKQLRAIGQIKESDISTVITELKTGDINGFITTQAFPGMLYPVKAVSADAGLKSTTRTLGIQLTVKNADELLRPGMFIEGTLEIGQNQQKQILPASAVLEDEGASFVFVKHSDSMYLRRDIGIESRHGDTVVVSGGLEDGTEIVVEGGFLLKSDILRGKMGAGCAH
ncbi:MAG: efflux RND transporter periplasmic adaptor subunit [Candidatus Riflebacteria bacterium]|nr:efflux RND transporter periplasmic adaptor subunit [Candidatus Riflebacteria bacterium]